jgi:hypothetical protein
VEGERYLDDATAKFSIRMQEAPRTVAADPDFDVFRLLHPEEIPATVNAVKGSSALNAVIAEDSPEPWAEIFRGLLTGLNHGGTHIWSESRFAAEDTAGEDVLFFGMPKRKKGRAMLSELGDAVVPSSRAFQVREGISSRNADTMFTVCRRKQTLVAVFISVEGTDVETVVRTARKITHYGRYGWLSFKGGINIGKGVGEVPRSSLVANLGNNS